MAIDIAGLAEQVRSALEAGDLGSYSDFLADDVRWGPADEPEWGCRNRREVLSWYGAARDRGMRATVEEVFTGEGCIVVGLTVSDIGGSQELTRRWQVLTVRGDQIAEIVGFDDRDQAVARAGVRA